MGVAKGEEHTEITLACSLQQAYILPNVWGTTQQNQDCVTSKNKAMFICIEITHSMLYNFDI